MRGELHKLSQHSSHRRATLSKKTAASKVLPSEFDPPYLNQEQVGWVKQTTLLNQHICGKSQSSEVRLSM